MISSQPQDFDEIIEKVKDAFSQSRLVGTPILNRFFDDIVTEINGIETSQGSDFVSSLMGRTAQLEYDVIDNPFTMDTTGFTMDTTHFTMDMSKA